MKSEKRTAGRWQVSGFGRLRISELGIAFISAGSRFHGGTACKHWHTRGRPQHTIGSIDRDAVLRCRPGADCRRVLTPLLIACGDRYLRR